jgi:hypothetical protein
MHGNQKYDERHGGPYDRGAADSYYRSGLDPHYYVGATGRSPRVELNAMQPEEVEAYLAGYTDNEAAGNFKY